jgi:hypothetical protein
MFGVVEATWWPPQTPPLREFVLSPGFAGMAIALGAIVASGAMLYTSRRTGQRVRDELDQQDRHQQEDRADRDREARIRRCWERFVWLIDTATSEPVDVGVTYGEQALLGLSPDLALAILQGLEREAEDVDDKTLIDAVAVYLAQFGAVLAQEGGPAPQSAGRNGAQEASTGEGGASGAAATREDARRP